MVKAFSAKRKEKNGMDDNKIVELYLSRDESAVKETIAKFGKKTADTRIWESFAIS